MPTIAAHINSRDARRRLLVLLVVAGSLAALVSGLSIQGRTPSSEELEGRAPTPEELRPSVEAAFPRESYAPRSLARLAIFGSDRDLTVQLFHVGPEHVHTVGYSEMQGVPVSTLKRVVVSHGTIPVRIGSWPTGLYFARLTARDGRVGFAPFVLRPHRLGEHRIAVVLPTMTWQAYNLRDDNGDGKGDTWYADWKKHTALLGRPYLNRGVPYNFRRYDLPFLHWLSWTGRQVDVLSDAELDSRSRSAKELASAYDLIVFPGHHEYVTTHEYDVVQGYRDLGGNLAFLSANNFFWQIVKHGKVMERTDQWRNLGRPEAALIGTQYRGNDRGSHRGPWIVRAAAPGRFFAGTGLKHGSTFGSGGIEIDETTSASPRGIQVLAEIPDLFGPGFTAQMTYYTTPAGAKVFAAGAFTLAGAVLDDPLVGKLMVNLWAGLSTP
jgi:hypothetical protein